MLGGTKSAPKQQGKVVGFGEESPVLADLGTGSPWPLRGRAWSGVVVKEQRQEGAGGCAVRGDSLFHVRDLEVPRCPRWGRADSAKCSHSARSSRTEPQGWQLQILPSSLTRPPRPYPLRVPHEGTARQPGAGFIPRSPSVPTCPRWPARPQPPAGRRERQAEPFPGHDPGGFTQVPAPVLSQAETLLLFGDSPSRWEGTGAAGK